MLRTLRNDTDKLTTTRWSPAPIPPTAKAAGPAIARELAGWCWSLAVLDD
jgi:hypothetical protein